LWTLEVDLYGGPGQEFAFSPDGRTFAASAFDGVVRVWELASGRERHRFTGHRSGTRSVAFSPDGRRLASASEDCTVLVWDVSTPQRSLVERATHDQLWEALTAPDAVEAHRALVTLAATPDTSVPFLKERLAPATASPEPVPRATVRGVEALERMGHTPSARRVLEELARLPAEGVAGREARAAHRRLGEVRPDRK